MHVVHLVFGLAGAGRVVAAGTPETLRNNLQENAGTPLTVATSSPSQALRVARENGFQRAATFGRKLRLLSGDIERDKQGLTKLFQAKNIDVSDWQRDDVTMEDVFVDSILSQEQSLGKSLDASHDHTATNSAAQSISKGEKAS